MFILQSFPEQIRGHLPCSWFVLIQVPHERIQRDVLLNEEMINVVTDDVVVKPLLPQGFPSVDSLLVGMFRDGRLERPYNG